MRAYIIRRLLLMIPTLLLVSILVFLLIRFIPGDVIDAMLTTSGYQGGVESRAAPNVMPPIIIIFSITVGATIVAEASLSFLGFGLPPDVPSWGGMLSREGRQYMTIAPRLAIWPGLCLTIVVYGINMFGDAVRDLLDPRLRGGGGRYGAPKE